MPPIYLILLLGALAVALGAPAAIRAYRHRPAPPPDRVALRRKPLDVRRYLQENPGKPGRPFRRAEIKNPAEAGF